jgi:4-aminobutyrate---pyruvate transaminase
VESFSSLAKRDISHHFHPYSNPVAVARDGPLVIAGADGVHVIDERGKRYIEGMSGLWCASLGFNEPRLAAAAEKQMRTLAYYHTFSGKVNNVVAALSEVLTSLAPTAALRAGRVLFANSGSEANDSVVKLVRYYHNAIGKPLKKKIIARVKGYHGVTLASASLSGIPVMHKHFDLPMEGILRVGCPHAYQFAQDGESEEAFVARLVRELENLIAQEGSDTIGAFFAEPVQGAGGVLIPPPGYFEKIQAVLRKHEILFVADEVITGFGRTGNRFGSQTYGITPDFLVTAKQITSGYVPLSAVFVSDFIYEACAKASAEVGVFGHGYTYSGHPLACAVALETLKIYEERDVIGRVNVLASAFAAGLATLGAHPLVGHFRSVGLIGAIELAQSRATRTPFPPANGVGAYLVQRAQAHGLILRVMAGDVIACCPPLIITEAELATLFARFEAALADTATWVAQTTG